MTIQEAQDILREYTKNHNLIKHAQAVSAVMRFSARKFHEDGDLWGITGLLHDFDYEIHPMMPDHPMKGSIILRKRGVPEEIIHGILAHAPFTGETRGTLMKKTLFASDELAGFCIAVALVSPEKKLANVTVKRVLKKLREATKQDITDLGKSLEGMETRITGSIRDLNTTFVRSQGYQNERMDQMDAKLDAIIEMLTMKQEMRNLIRELKANVMKLDESPRNHARIARRCGAGKIFVT